MLRGLSAVLILAALPAAGAGAQESAPERRIAVGIDATMPRARISPYLYGQFIEHIGDPVNRSVWAEMIDDRKFYYAVARTTRAVGATRSHARPPAQPVEAHRAVLGGNDGSQPSLCGEAGNHENSLSRYRHRLHGLVADAEPEPVNVGGGQVQGVVKDSLTLYTSFPFAAPPVEISDGAVHNLLQVRIDSTVVGSRRDECSPWAAHLPAA